MGAIAAQSTGVRSDSGSTAIVFEVPSSPTTVISSGMAPIANPFAIANLGGFSLSALLLH